ncbi:hypothetical protein V9K67_23970 [Paraflavisolibacter sp. H34]|uniref:hypothetical protein n=1 Tax=Huijunlia imazamoxiresistens TaxID=3127457 RepID=UPI0030173172
MKIKVLLYSLLFFLTACSPAPQKIADKFFDDLNYKKLESALKVCTPEMKTAVTNLFASYTTRNMNEYFEHEVVEEHTVGDLSMVKVKMIVKGKPDKFIKVKMIKSNGKWLVAGLN